MKTYQELVHFPWLKIHFFCCCSLSPSRVVWCEAWIARAQAQGWEWGDSGRNAPISALVSIGAELIGFRAEAPNSVAFGTFAITLLCVLMAALILLDLNKIYTDCKMMKANIASMMNKKSNKVSDSSTAIQDESTA